MKENKRKRKSKHGYHAPRLENYLAICTSSRVYVLSNKNLHRLVLQANHAKGVKGTLEHSTALKIVTLNSTPLKNITPKIILLDIAFSTMTSLITKS